jgi:hypothetical protein
MLLTIAAASFALSFFLLGKLWNGIEEAVARNSVEDLRPRYRSWDRRAGR